MKTSILKGLGKLEQQWRKCIKMKGDYIENIVTNFSFLGILKYMRSRTFWSNLVPSWFIRGSFQKIVTVIKQKYVAKKV